MRSERDTPEKQQKAIIRELLIALSVLVVFFIMGHRLLKILQISEHSFSQSQNPGRLFNGLLALFLAWLIAGIILVLSAQLERFIGNKGLSALQRLMGLILTTIAVEMFLTGIRMLTQH